MSPKFLDCPICLQRYDSVGRVPKLLPRCGHTLCSQCLIQILNKTASPECPLGCGLLSDKKKPKIKDFPSNLIVIQQLDAGPDQFSICPLHAKKQMLACIDDGIPICKYCVVSGKHENHLILSLKEAKAKAALKSEKLQEIFKFYQQGAYQMSCEILEQERFILKQNIRENFSRLQDLLRKRENDTLKQVDVLFNQKQSKLQKLEQEHAKLIQEIQILQIYLSGLVLNKSFFEAFNNKTVEHFLLNNVKEEASRFANKMQESNLISINKLSDTICLSIQNFQPFNDEFNNLEVSERLNSVPENKNELLNQLEKAHHVEVEDEEEKKDFRKVLRNSHIYEEEEKIDPGFLNNSNDNEEEIEMLPCQLDKNLNFDEALEKENYWSHKDKIQDDSYEEERQEILPIRQDTPRFLEYLRQATQRGELNLDFRSAKFNRETMRYINQVFQENSLPLILQISITTQHLLNYDAFSDFCESSLWRNSHIHSLILDIKKQIHVKNFREYFVRIIKCIRKMKKLRELSFKVSNTNADNSIIMALAKPSIICVTSLKSLKLDFSNTSVDNQGFANFFASSQNYLSSLDVLHVNFGGNKIQSDSVITFSQNVLPHLKKLRSFSLRLAGSHLTDSAAQELFKNLKVYLHSVRDFQLDLEGSKVSNISIEKFAKQTLPYMNKLESFELHLSNTVVTDQGIDALWLALKGIVARMKIFRLDLPQTKVSNETLETLKIHTLPSFKELSSFELRLADSGVTFRGVERLLLAIENSPLLMRNLKWFEITLQKDQMNDLKKRFHILNRRHYVHK